MLGGGCSGQNLSWAAPAARDFPLAFPRSCCHSFGLFFSLPNPAQALMPSWHLFPIHCHELTDLICSQLVLRENDMEQTAPPPPKAADAAELISTCRGWAAAVQNSTAWEMEGRLLASYSGLLREGSASARSPLPREPSALPWSRGGTWVGAVALLGAPVCTVPATHLLICSGLSSKLWPPVEILPKTVSIHTQLQIFN